jgi:hypothetical protein
MLQKALNESVDGVDVMSRVNADVDERALNEGTAKVNRNQVEEYLQAARDTDGGSKEPSASPSGEPPSRPAPPPKPNLPPQGTKPAAGPTAGEDDQPAPEPVQREEQKPTPVAGGPTPPAESTPQPQSTPARPMTTSQRFTTDRSPTKDTPHPGQGRQVSLMIWVGVVALIGTALGILLAFLWLTFSGG